MPDARLPMTEKRLHNPEFELAKPEAVRAHQLTALRALLEKTQARNAFFADHWRAAKIDPIRIDSLEAFARLPMVEKADFIRDQADLPPYGRRHEHVRSLGVPLVTLTSS